MSANHAFGQLYGLSQLEDSPHFGFERLFADSKQCEQCLKDLRAGTGFVGRRHATVCAEGMNVVVRHSAVPYADEGTGQTCYEGTIEAVYIEPCEGLRESFQPHDSLVQVLDKIPYAIDIHDLDGQILYVNPAWVHLYGYDPAVGKLPTVFEVDTNLSEDFIRKFWQEHYAKGESYCVQTRNRTKGRGLIDVMINAIPMEYQGTPAMLVCAGDITELEESRRQSRQLAEIVEHTEGFAMLIDIDGGLVWANSSYLRKTGYALNEIAGRPFCEVLCGIGSSQRANHRLEQALKRQEALSTTMLNRCKDGSFYEVELGLYPVRDNSGNLVRFVSTQRDVSAQVESFKRERALRKKAEKLALQAQAGERSKAEFLSMMSHEIRSPLNPILGLTELLLEDPQLSESSRHVVRVIRDAGKTLQTLLNDILDISRLDAGRVELEITTVEIRPLLDSIHSMFYPNAASKGLELNLEVSDDVPATIRADATRLRQILWNLLGNAIKFTEQGCVALCVSAEQSLHQTRLRFSVSDTGCGIETEHLEHLFEPFTQAGRDIYRKYGGTGLGLAISRQLAHLMNGALTVQTKPGKGSTFTFILDEYLQDKSTSATVEEAKGVYSAPASPSRGITVLWLDDDSAGFQVAQYMFSHLGHRCDHARSAHEAIRAMQAQKYDLVVIDWDMPDQEGLIFARLVKEHGDWYHVPYLAGCSVTSAPEEVEQARQLGVDAFLSKPFDLDELTRLAWLASNKR